MEVILGDENEEDVPQQPHEMSKLISRTSSWLHNMLPTAWTTMHKERIKAIMENKMMDPMTCNIRTQMVIIMEHKITYVILCFILEAMSRFMLLGSA